MRGFLRLLANALDDACRAQLLFAELRRGELSRAVQEGALASFDATRDIRDAPPANDKQETKLPLTG